MEKVIKCCEHTHLFFNTKKGHMMMSEGIVLGNFISIVGIQVDPAKIKVILNILIPPTQKEVHHFLGHVGYYRHFIEKKSKLSSPIFTLLIKDDEFNWTNACQTTLAELKKRLSTIPILHGPNWAFPFHIFSNASDTAIRVVLGQLEDHNLYSIYYISKNMVLAELNYNVTEK